MMKPKKPPNAPVANKLATALQPRDLGGTSCVRIGLDRDLAGIDIRLDAYWWEDPTSQNVVIRNNTLRDSPYSLYAACCAFQMSGAISVRPIHFTGENRGHRIHPTFRHPPGRFLE